jgi:hypothetical protein
MIYFLILNLLVPLISEAQKFDWVKQTLKSDGSIIELSSAVDSKDNLICLAYYFSNPPTYPKVELCSTLFSPGNIDFPVACLMYKLDKSGNCIWSHQLSTLQGATENLLSLKIDHEDNYYFVSSFSGIITLAPGVFIDSGSPQQTQIVVSKFNKEDKLLWYKIMKVRDSTKVSPFTWAIHIDQLDNLFILVDHSHEPLIYDNIPILYSNINLKYNSTIIKLNQDGNLVWSKPIQSPNGGVELFNIKSDKTGNIVVIGNIFEKSIQIDQQTYLNSDQSSIPNADAIVFKLSSDGEVLWLKGYGSGQTQDYFAGLEIDFWGNIYISGVSRLLGPYKILDSLINNSNLIHPSFIAMVDSNGNRKWIKVLDLGLANNLGYFTEITKDNKLISTWSLTKDSVFIDDQLIFRAGKGANSQYDMVCLITNPSGRVENAYCWGGSDFDRILDVSLQSDDGVILSGQFSSDTLTLGEHSLYKLNKPKGYSSDDGFIARISPDGMVGSKDLRNPESSLISIIPNPTRDLIQIRFDEVLNADGKVDILTTTGTLMKSINIGKGSTSTTIDVRDWPAGVYFVRYRDIEGRSSVERVVVE